MNTIEGNKLIAEFMGGEFEIRTLGDDPYKYQQEWVTFLANDSPESKAVAKVSELMRHWNEEKKTNLYFPSGHLKYHTSWDWLMPVVEKIQNIPPNRFIIDNNESRISGDTKIKVFDSSKIKSVWLCATQFILWYNTQSK